MVAGDDDAEERMIGDINLFLYPDEDCEEEEEEAAAVKVGHVNGTATRHGGNVKRIFGEVDIMIAEKAARGNGLGKAALAAFLSFIRRHQGDILAGYAGGGGAIELTRLVAKISERNTTSRALFKCMGFVQEKGPNYFGEVEMVMRSFTEWEREGDAMAREVLYQRA